MNRRLPILKLEHFLYLALLGVALLVRLHTLGAYPLADAEAHEALLAWQWVRGLPMLGVPSSPAYFFFASLSFLLGGDGDTLARLVPALFGASFVLLPMLFRDVLGGLEALLASALLALSAGLVATSRTADGTMLALAGLGWGLALLRLALRSAEESTSPSAASAPPSSKTPPIENPASNSSTAPDDSPAPVSALAPKSRALLMGSAACLGLGLASGAAFLTGGVACVLAALLVAVLNPSARQPLRSAWAQVRKQGWVFFGTLGVTGLIVSTVGLTYLPGLGALVESWQAWLAGFLPSAPGQQLWTYLLFLIAYEPLLLVFGVIGAVEAFRRRAGTRPSAAPELTDANSPPARTAHAVGVEVWLMALAVAGLALGLLYSGRALTMVVWVTAPLAALSAIALAAIFRRLLQIREWPQMVVQMVLILALVAFASIRLTGYVLDAGALLPQLTSPANVNLSLAVLAILIAVGITLLFGAGWSWAMAGVGAALCAALALSAVSLDALWGLTQTRPTSPAELWWQTPTDAAVNRLVQSVSRISNDNVGTAYDLPLTVQSDTPGAPGWVLRWAFRNFTHVTFVEQVTPQATTGSVVVVTPAPAAGQNPTLGAAFAGEAFTFERFWTPGSLSGTDWLAWAFYRRAPISAEQLILWLKVGS